MREVAGGQLFQVKEPDVGVHAAAVAFPGAEVHADGHISQCLAVGRNGAELAIRHRQLLRQATLGRDLIELVEAVLGAGHGGSVEDALAIRIPLQHPVRRPVMRQPLGQAAPRRHDVDVLVPIVIACEGQQRSVRREARERFLAFRRTQPHRHPARLLHDPDVAGINEGDLRGRHCRLAHHARIQPGRHSLLGPCGRGERKEAKAKSEYPSRGSSRMIHDVFYVFPCHGQQVPGVTRRQRRQILPHKPPQSQSVNLRQNRGGGKPSANPLRSAAVSAGPAAAGSCCGWSCGHSRAPKRVCRRFTGGDRPRARFGWFRWPGTRIEDGRWRMEAQAQPWPSILHLPSSILLPVHGRNCCAAFRAP